MAVIPDAKSLVKRYSCYDDGYCYYSGWDLYGRWILLAVIIIGAFFFFLLFACITARRRRRLNQRPFPMTGWAAPQHGQPQYTQGPPPQQGGYQQPPPQYSGAAGSYYNPGQQSGVTQPGNVYQPTRDAGPIYNAPEGPPPGK